MRSRPINPVRVEVREVESIPLSSAGKYRFTRSDVNAGAAAANQQREPASQSSS